MAEEEISRSDLDYTVVRFTIGFGEGDEFLNRLAAIVKMSPLAPVVGDGKSVFQPISVDDVARCVVESIGGVTTWRRRPSISAVPTTSPTTS